MKLDKIERSCTTILSELKSGKFTKNELVMLNQFFTKVVEVTGKMLKKIEGES